MIGTNVWDIPPLELFNILSRPFLCHCHLVQIILVHATRVNVIKATGYRSMFHLSRVVVLLISFTQMFGVRLQLNPLMVLSFMSFLLIISQSIHGFIPSNINLRCLLCFPNSKLLLKIILKHQLCLFIPTAAASMKNFVTFLPRSVFPI